MNIQIQKVTPEEADSIIETRQPFGLFYCIDDGPDIPRRYVGIDNLYGDAWTEDFGSLSACKRWLTKVTGR